MRGRMVLLFVLAILSFAMLCVTVVLLFLIALCEFERQFSLVIGEKLLDIDDGVARGALPIIAPLTLLLIMTFLYVDYVESKRLENSIVN
jgi:hypothetical protein